MQYEAKVAGPGSATDRAQTLNERLNQTLDHVGNMCDRLDRVLGSVNGTPQRPERNPGAVPTPIRATLPMAQVVENMEQTAARLNELVNGVERIA